MRFVKLDENLYLNLDGILGIGVNDETHQVEIISTHGHDEDMGPLDDPKVQVFLTVVAAYSDDTFYEALRVSPHAQPRPVPKDGEGSQAVPPKSQV